MIVIFGNSSNAKPLDADISVGIAIYAQAADSLFLFHDFHTGTIYILQAKGCFTSLLPSGNQEQEIGDHSKWTDLSVMEYAHLLSVELPPPRKLSADELALSDGLTIKLEDLYQGKIKLEDLDGVTTDENLRSIIMSEMSRGSDVERVQVWLQSQQRPLPVRPKDRHDVEGKAKTSITNLLRNMRLQSPQPLLDADRAALRQAHQENSRNFETRLKQHETDTHKVVLANERFAAASRHASSYAEARSQSRDDGESSSHTAGRAFSKGYSTTGDPPAQSSSSNNFSSTSWSMVNKPEPSKPSAPVEEFQETYLQGFKRLSRTSNEHGPLALRPKDAAAASELQGQSSNSLPGRVPNPSEFIGKCSLCHQESILALLLKKPSDAARSVMPPRTVHSPWLYPLEEIFTPSIYCDACAHHLIDIGKDPDDHEIIGAIALVSIDNNEDAWEDALGMLLDALIPSTLPSWCHSQPLQFLDGLLGADANSDILLSLPEDDLFRQAVEWIQDELMKLDG